MVGIRAGRKVEPRSLGERLPVDPPVPQRFAIEPDALHHTVQGFPRPWPGQALALRHVFAERDSSPSANGSEWQ
jgi:hypothetical protein